MPTISKKEYEEYKKLCYDRDHGRFLTSDGLRLICESYNKILKPLGSICWRHWLGLRVRSIKNGNICCRI